VYVSDRHPQYYEQQGGDPTIDTQIVKLKASAADLLYNMTTPKFGAQAIKKVAELGWKPVHVVDLTSSSLKTVLEPAGLEIGITIAGGAGILLLDEPTAGMNQDETAHFIELIRRIRKDRTVVVTV
jgi:ABC-type branched-subunit amino acid transport system ATPase component